MAEHRIEITDSFGTSVQILVRLPLSGQATWLALDNSRFVYNSGVADTGREPPNPLSWIALYGGNEIDDAKLVLHLDNFSSLTGINRVGGEGTVYKQDHLFIMPGKIKWQLLM